MLGAAVEALHSLVAWQDILFSSRSQTDWDGLGCVLLLKVVPFMPSHRSTLCRGR